LWSGLDERKYVEHPGDFEQSQDTTLGSCDGKAPAVLARVVMRLEEQPQPRRIHELEVAHVEDDVSSRCGSKFESLDKLWSGGEVELTRQT
jgi:hypothetical protein